MILFQQVTKQFPNGTIALEEASFHVEPGEFGFLMGPSGAGKTTILRLLLKELKPTSGKIIIKGKDLAELAGKHLPEHRRKIGAAFQDFKLIEDRTIKENVSLITEMLISDMEQVNRQVEEILELVGLRKKGNLFPSQLSGGELQRTAIARALATKPEILFADEPTGNLDQATAWEIINVLLGINETGTTVLVATHNQEIVKALRKRVIELDEGRIITDTKKPKQKKKSKKTTQKDQKAKKKEEETEG